MISWHGRIFRSSGNFWSNIRKFFYKHKTLFDIIFLSTYTIEQLVLFILTLILPNSSAILAGVFAIVVITTISLEKICMESRYRISNEQLIAAEIERTQIFELIEKQRKEKEELIRIIEDSKQN